MKVHAAAVLILVDLAGGSVGLCRELDKLGRHSNR